MTVDGPHSATTWKCCGSLRVSCEPQRPQRSRETCLYGSRCLEAGCRRVNPRPVQAQSTGLSASFEAQPTCSSFSVGLDRGYFGNNLRWVIFGANYLDAVKRVCVLGFVLKFRYLDPVPWWEKRPKSVLLRNSASRTNCINCWPTQGHHVRVFHTRSLQHKTFIT